LWLSKFSLSRFRKILSRLSDGPNVKSENKKLALFAEFCSLGDSFSLEPSVPSRALELLRGVTNVISDSVDSVWSILVTIARVLAILLAIVGAIYSYRQLTRDTLIIEPISVPKQYADMGITGEVMAKHIRDALGEIEATPQISVRKDVLAMWSEETSTPDVEVPGTKLTLKTVVEMVRAMIPILPQPRNVTGEITLRTRKDSDREKILSSENEIQITLRIKRGESAGEPIKFSLQTNDSEAVARSVAEAIVRRVNPYLLGSYRLDHDDPVSAIAIAQSMIGDPFQDRLHQSAAYNLWGNAIDRHEHAEEAIAKYQKAIEFDPKYAVAYSNWGNVFYDQKKYDEAIAKYQKAIEVDPKYALAYSNWGSVFYDQKKYDEAIAKYQKAIEVDPKFALAYSNWGNVLEEQKKYDEAIAKYQKTIELDPKYAPAYSAWGNVLYDQKKYDEAIAKYQKTIELDPKYAPAYGNWGSALVQQNKYGEAIAKYQKATELDPKFAIAYTAWGFVLYEQNKYDEAIVKYQKAIELDPKYALAYNYWGNALDEQKKYDEAIAKYQKATKLDPTYARAYTNWGNVLDEQKKYDEAIAKYQKAIELDPTFALAYTYWGDVLEKLGRHSEAQEKYVKSRELR